MANEKILLKNEDLTEDRIEDIISLKQEHWPYPMESQKEWMKKNHQKGDLHLLLYESGKPIAYLDMVQVRIKMDEVEKSVLGIGNVCVSKAYQGKGIGKECVLAANKEIVDRGEEGILLCRLPLVQFYTKCGWSLIKAEKVMIQDKDFKDCVMILNGQQVEVKNLFIGRSF